MGVAVGVRAGAGTGAGSSEHPASSTARSTTPIISKRMEHLNIVASVADVTTSRQGIASGFDSHGLPKSIARCGPGFLYHTSKTNIK
jgi:hypothetical protein